MDIRHFDAVADSMALRPSQVGAVAQLLSEGATVPFIARYRKEATGSLDEVVITSIRDRLHQLAELDSRRETIIKSLEQNGHLSPELETKVLAAATLAALEDLYLPFKPKRRTKATIARERGLEPLAVAIFELTSTDPRSDAHAYVAPDREIHNADDALDGARDIIAEWISEHAEARERLRKLFAARGVLKSRVVKGRESDGIKYRDYFEWEEPVATAPSHRILAVRRGEKEDILSLSMAPSEAEAIALLDSLFVKDESAASDQIRLAVTDSYKRLLSRSMETELRLAAKERADETAIGIFADNLRQLLLTAPLGPRRVMGIDPGFRTGCKVACLDRQGKLLHHDAVFPHLSESRRREAARTLIDLLASYHIEAVAIGNGTAGRETQEFIEVLDAFADIPVVMVNESGASVYSASQAARDEFPDLDLTIRGAVSIGRRLMDPLAELVKIDPKAIGVGQYQHDVDQSALKKALDDVVISCVNRVGVDVNRASAELLSYVSGLGPVLARNIIRRRNENGPFATRDELKQVSRLGPKAYELCAGFLRIPDGQNPLDASAVHPESYPVVHAMALDLNCTVADLIQDSQQRSRIDLSRYIGPEIGLPTLKDILAELEKPGRDPRRQFETFSFAEGISKLEDLVPGQKLPGIVTNLTAFGAFVDVGVHQDGLVHISEMADRFVKNPADVVKVHQVVTVRVLKVDAERKRISLSMKQNPDRSKPARRRSVGTPPPKTSPRPAAGRPRKAPFNNPFAEFFNKSDR